jgi:CDP-diacylglycerol--glycerol-3-phosphate 3-phosphatidyltransferase
MVVKVKTFVQMAAITVLLALDPAVDAGWVTPLAYAMLYTAALLTIWSMFIYLKAAWRIILERQQAQDSPDNSE